MNNEYFRAGNPNTPPDELRELYSSASVEVRLRLAENAKCPLDALARLSMDSRPEVRAAAGTNPAAPLAIVERIARDPSSEVRLLLASEPSLKKTILERLSEDPDPPVRERARQTLTGLELESRLKESGFQKSVGDTARLGDLIVMAGILTQEEVNEFVGVARETGVALGHVLVERKALSQVVIVQLLNVQAALRTGQMSTAQALVKLETCKHDGLSQRQTQRIMARNLVAVEADFSLGIRSLIDAAPDAIVIFAKDGTVIEWNREAELILGYTRRQAVGMQFCDLLNQQSDMGSTSVKSLFAPAAERKHQAFELEVRDGRGGVTPLEITVSRDDSEDAPYIAFIRDVSERKKLEGRRSAQYAATKLLAEARSLAQAGPELLRVLCETTGWEIGELLILEEQTEHLKRVAVWCDADTPEPIRPEVYARGVGVPGYVWNHKRPTWIDNATRKGHWTTGSSQTAALGLPIMFQNEFHGVLYLTTKRMRMPEKDPIEMLANVCSQIAQYVQRHRAEKARQHVLLLQQREDFMATLAHDLKTPLISGERVLELLVNGSLGALHPDQKKVLQMLRDSNHSLLCMVKNLLSVYRYESGVEQLRPEPTDLRNLLSKSVEEIRPIFHEKSITLITDYPTTVDAFVCDGLELRRVFANLLSNAVKFTLAGGKITVVLEDATEERAVKIKVIDTGVGIPQAELKNVFRRFWQGNQCNRGIGTGLGLHLCWKIVEAHGGTINVESTERKGSTFTVWLPRSLRAVMIPVEAPGTAIDASPGSSSTQIMSQRAG